MEVDWRMRIVSVLELGRPDSRIVRRCSPKENMAMILVAGRKRR